MKAIEWPGLLGIATVGLVAACGSQSSGNLENVDEAGVGSDGGVTGDSSTFVGSGDGSFVGGGGEGGVGANCTPCSADLHQVLDCATQQVVRTCPSDTGCSADGQCVTPCQSATSNHTSIGCEYYALVPDGYSTIPDSAILAAGGSEAGSCYAVFVANTWTTPVSVNVEFNGQALDTSKSVYTAQPGGGAAPTYTALPGGAVPAGQVGILFLSQSTPGDGSGNATQTPCPAGVNVAYTTTDPAIHGSGRGHAFHVTTSAPVVAFDIWPYGGASSYVSSATLLLPTSVWNTNYVAVTAYAPESQGIGTADSNVSFVASQDQTTVTINPVVDIVGGAGAAKASKGAASMYVLNKGESIQFEQQADLSGSVVLADKPIGTWGGHWGMDVPMGTQNLDAAHQQIPPVSALGSEYVGVRYRTRTAGTEESVPWRIMGVVDGTKLSYEPSAPGNAPSTLGRGQLVEFDSPGPFVVKSQDSGHPFYLAAHMTGLGSPYSLGDPETVNVVPPQQFMSSYVFFTDPTYKETNLVVVRSKGGPAVSLDCVSGPLAGWQPVGTRYEYTRVDVQAGGAKAGNCDNGRHEMTSSGPFGVTVWGFDTAVSYAYPAGAAVRPINAVVVPPVQPR